MSKRIKIRRSLPKNIAIPDSLLIGGGEEWTYYSWINSLSLCEKINLYRVKILFVSPNHQTIHKDNREELKFRHPQTVNIRCFRSPNPKKVKSILKDWYKISDPEDNAIRKYFEFMVKSL